MQVRSRMMGRPPGILLLGAVLPIVCPLAGAEKLTPVQKVIELLNGMVHNGQEEKHQEKVAFASFSEFCRHTEETKVEAISNAEKEIVTLEDSIAKAEADIEGLTLEIGKLDADTDDWASQKAESTAIRKEEKDDYQASMMAYEDSLDALDRAINVLKAKSVDVKQAPEAAGEAAKLLEVASAGAKGPTARQLTEFSKVLRHSLLEVGHMDSDEGAPEANAYEFQSSSIVETLEKLRLKFQDEKEVLAKEELNRRHSYEQVMQVFTDDIEHAEKTRARKMVQKGETEAELADAQGNLEETKAGKAADEKFLADLRANCETKSAEFEHRQKLRDEELAALAKAIEIISSEEVAGAAETHLPSALLQSSHRRPSLLQLRGADDDSTSPQAKAAAFLAKQARSAKSVMLATLAERLQNDPFAKVKQLIKDLLVRLLDEANEEADHKAWCDKEVSTNKQSRDELSAQVEELTSKVDELSALEETLQSEIAELSEQIADVDAAVAQATKDRAEEKARNEATLADAKGAQDAVIRATKVLQEFYDRAGDATALLQKEGGRQAPEEPSTWDTPYQGLQGSSKGVIGMLDVIHSDFARLEAETSLAEGDAARRHHKFLDDSAVDRTIKDKDMRHKGFKRDSTLRILRETKKELEGTQEELSDALKYYDKLKPACIDTGLSYEERVEKRKQEIQSLKEALRILGGEDLP